MKKSVIGILAHVDAGKTTLAEAMLYKTGELRKIGRVDRGDTALDTHTLERERGITIFAGQAEFTLGDTRYTLLDTPGHVDFSAEAERMLQVLDYAVLVISGSDGVQSHTRTVWKLLAAYNIPTFIFVTKTDLARKTNDEIMTELRSFFGDGCVDFSNPGSEQTLEALSLCDESALDSYLETGSIPEDGVFTLIAARKVFLCCFGSGLKLEGIDEFLKILEKYARAREYTAQFGAKVFKINYDKQGSRQTFLKVTGGTLRVRDTLEYDGKTEKVNALRIYSGAKFTAVDEVPAGGVCAVTGLTSTRNGQGFGIEAQSQSPVLEPVMNYRVVLPEGVDAVSFLPKLRLLEEEEPMLHITYNEHLKEIHVGLMGEVQTGILKALIAERFGVDVTIDCGRVLYKETVEEIVEGVGHYEPLRHYAEVHLIIEPAPRGSGISIATKADEDMLSGNWQRLIMSHILEKQHLGVLTGSPLTDVKITLAAGRAHLKHTEGGDFRQATYRAVRHGLMCAKSVLLEPFYAFRLEVPTENIGRAISDIRTKSGSFEAPRDSDGISVLTGKAPVTELNGYASEVASYTGGMGRLFCELSGYDICHDSQRVIEEFSYNPETDLDNSADSVFCAHGGGFAVKWNKVTEYMHIESCLKSDENPITPELNKRNFHIDDKELAAIMAREFGEDKHPFYRYSHGNTSAGKAQTDAADYEIRKKYVIVDGYNVIFAWEDLNELSKTNLDIARDRLADMLCNYTSFTQCETVLVFDAYRVKGNTGKKYDYNNIHVAFTKEKETADTYIERLIGEIGKNGNVRVVTSDGLIQISAVRAGVLRVSAREFRAEVDKVYAELEKLIADINKIPPVKVAEILKSKLEESEG